MNDRLHPTTILALLLCGRLEQRIEVGALPLTPREYAAVLTSLDELGLPVSSLLDGENIPAQLPVPAERLAALLQRRTALETALDGWESAGIWVMGPNDPQYPARLAAIPSPPPLLYAAGDPVILPSSRRSLAVVGSRKADEMSLRFAYRIGEICARDDVLLVSGGARGIDRTAASATLKGGGRSIAVLSDSLLRLATRKHDGEMLATSRLLLLTPYSPEAPFSVGNAMGRNRLIYGLADVALVASCEDGRGGTWSGAVEALERGEPPVFVRLEPGNPPGNDALLKRGAHGFPDWAWSDLDAWLALAAPGSEMEQRALLERRDEEYL